MNADWVSLSRQKYLSLSQISSLTMTSGLVILFPNEKVDSMKQNSVGIVKNVKQAKIGEVDETCQSCF